MTLAPVDPEERAARLYALLPAIHRQRDAERGEPLRALMAVLARQGAAVEADLRGLYDDLFIETCAEWVVPYIGDLLGVRGLREIEGAGVSRRALVANTLAYRRRKGVAAALEQLAQDATGWRALAREMFLTLAGTQNLNHLRPEALRTPDLRDAAAFDPPQGPFGRAAHMVDVRSVALGRGRHNIPNVAIHLWRLQAYRHTAAELRPAAPADAYFVAPSGVDAPLFNPPRSDAGLPDRADPRSAPGPLRRRALHDELEARRQALAEGRPAAARWFDAGPGARGEPAFALALDGADVPFERLAVCDLADWRQPEDSRDYHVTAPDGTVSVVALPIDAAVDPELGRLRLAPSRAGAVPTLTFSAGFPGDLGAGPYARRAYVEALMDRPATWAAGVSRAPVAPAAGVFATFADALAAWRAQPAGTVGVIAVMDSGRYVEDLTGADAITAPPGSRLLIVAADWPATQDPASPPGTLIRLPGALDPDGRRPHLVGAVEIEGFDPGPDETPGEVLVDGLLIEGAVTVRDGALGRLAFSHATLMPGASALGLALGNPELDLSLERCVTAGIAVAPAIARLGVVGCVVDGPVAAGATPVEICDATLLGPLAALTLEASGAILMEPATAARLQTGCVRYSWVAEGSTTPRRHRCQPQLALAAAQPAQAAAIRARLRPAFTALAFGAPGYGQLARSCAAEIAEGGPDGTEMGAFAFLRQPQRLANLRNVLPDYLPFGLEAGLFFET